MAADAMPSKSSTSTTSFLACDVFMDLDPLGTGRSKPYVDKKNFFQDVKNPPKKVLKDLVPPASGSGVITVTDILPVVTTAMEPVINEQTYSATTITSVPRHSGGSVSIAHPPPANVLFTGSIFTGDPFAETDPFDSADPFADSFKDDPFVSSFQRMEEFRHQLSREASLVVEEESPRPLPYGENGKNIFKGPLQVSLPPEPAPKSPRLSRQASSERSSTVRQRPQPINRVSTEQSPPKPPPKRVEVAAEQPPPRPPRSDPERTHSSDDAPPLPLPARRPKEPTPDRSTKPRLSSVTTNSSEDEYLSPLPPPLPGGRRFDITLSQLLTCGLDELASRLRVPAVDLASMTLAQLTALLRSYLEADRDRVNMNIEPSPAIGKEKIYGNQISSTAEFRTDFEDNFTPSQETKNSFVANFDNFEKKTNPSYDRYAVFREIQEEELKGKSLVELNEEAQNGDEDPDQEDDDSDSKDEITSLDELVRLNNERKARELEKQTRRLEQPLQEVSRQTPMKALDELTLDSFTMYRNSVSPSSSHIDAKIEDIKSVMKNLKVDQTHRSISPKESGTVVTESKQQDKICDRYAALREITITEPQDEFESLPPEPPKERKRSDEKSDGFDNSDFFDCIDNSSLSFTHVEDAFRKSPVVIKDKIEPAVVVARETKREHLLPSAAARTTVPPARLSAGSLSDVISGSSPDTAHKDKGPLKIPHVPTAGRTWAPLAPRSPSPWSSDSKESEGASPPALPRPRRRPANNWHSRQTSSSSRDVSPWEEEPPPVPRPHHRTTHHRDSRHNSAGSRECLDSGSGRDKDKIRDKRECITGRERDRELSRDRRDTGSIRDRRDSGSGRDRRDMSKERDHVRESRDRRDRRSRDRDKEWDIERDYSRDRDYRESKSRERLPKEHKDRDRHRKPRHSWEDEEDYSEGGGSGRSSPSRERWPDTRWRREERNYGSLGWRESRRRADVRLSEEPVDRRYGATLGSRGRRYGTRPREPERRRRPREPPEEPRVRPRDQRFSTDFSERDQSSPFDNDFVDTPTAKKRAPYSSLEGTRFAFDREEETTASPASVGSRKGDPESPATRFRFDSDSISPRSLFEDDFTAPARTPAASIAEEDENADTVHHELAEPRAVLRSKQRPHQDIKKSESVNIFVRNSDPFDGDDFFKCTGSDRAARRENWPGDFKAFDNV